MSIADAQRFTKDITDNKELADKIKAGATGLASLVVLGKASGYSFTIDEIKQVIRDAAKRNLTDDQLEAIAGGSGQGPTATQVATSASQVTAVAVQAEQAVVQLTVITVVASLNLVLVN